MAISTFASAVILFVLYPETQYTKRAAIDPARRRTLLDNWRFWSVSGGGPHKVSRFVPTSVPKPQKHTESPRISFRSALVYPFPYILHPVVIAVTIWASLNLMTSQYILVSNCVSLGNPKWWVAEINTSALDCCHLLLPTNLLVRPYPVRAHQSWPISRSPRGHLSLRLSLRSVGDTVDPTGGPVGTGGPSREASGADGPASHLWRHGSHPLRSL